MSLMSVDDALATLLASVPGPISSEMVPLSQAAHRVLAGSVTARRTQPPFPASAMDGYAVRAADAIAGAALAVTGESAAGRRFEGEVAPGEAVRIFTGAPVPPGADAILIQEHASGVGTVRITVTEAPSPGQFVRAAGLDFTEGAEVLPPGRRLDSAALGLSAAAGHPVLPVRRQPLVAILATGDELVLPGEPVGPDQIVASNSFAIAALVTANGGSVLDLGIARDDRADLAQRIGRARTAGADILVTLGGASVGEHDLVQEALTAQGMDLGFWKIAMRPGKPMMTGRLGPMIALGLPGNPVSSIVCGHLFLVPLIERLLGMPDADRDRTQVAVLGRDVSANDQRQDYLRSTLERRDGRLVVTPFEKQDSSMLATLARAEALVVRAAHAPEARRGDDCRVLVLR